MTESNVFPIDPFGNNQIVLEGQRFVCPKCDKMFYVPPKIMHDVKNCCYCGVVFEKIY